MGAELIQEQWFQDLVENDIRGKTPPDKHEWLRSGEIAEAWKAVLAIKKTNLDSQAAARKADSAVELGSSNSDHIYTENARWKKKVTRYRQALDECLIEAKAIVKQLDRTYNGALRLAAVLIAAHDLTETELLQAATHLAQQRSTDHG